MYNSQALIFILVKHFYVEVVELIRFRKPYFGLYAIAILKDYNSLPTRTLKKYIQVTINENLIDCYGLTMPRGTH